MLRARVRECARGRPRTFVRRYVSFSLLRLPDPKNLLVAGPPPSPSLGAHCPIERGMETFQFLKDPATRKGHLQSIHSIRPFILNPDILALLESSSLVPSNI